MRLSKEELKAAHNNIMTVMENHIMQMAGCNRKTANLIANEVLDFEAEFEQFMKEGVEAE